MLRHSEGAIRVIVVGLGSIGRDVVKALHTRPGVRLVAAADPAHAGRDLGQVAGIERLGVSVVRDAAAAFQVPGDVALVLTASGVAQVTPILEAAAAAGLNVVSSCEDLAFPEHGSRALAARLDAAARAHRVSILATGVNPGFVMDWLPLALAGACVRVDTIRVERVVDAAKRREPLRAKVGAGLSRDEFRAGVTEGRLGHRGLAESCALLGAGLGVRFDRIDTSLAPVLSTVKRPRRGIAVGRVAGVRQAAVGRCGGVDVVHLALEMSVGAPEPHDRIRIEGDPPLDVIVAGGVHGDRGTVGTLVNAIPAVVGARPGLLRVTDVPLYGAG